MSNTSPKVEEVIISKREVGDGSREKPHQTITEIFSKEGEFLGSDRIDNERLEELKEAAREVHDVYWEARENDEQPQIEDLHNPMVRLSELLHKI